ncbi:MAG: hypothetical protein IJF73_05495 [Clostridia bacterium]|nr:hypothetical protein [Clostridia bacterium]
MVRGCEKRVVRLLRTDSEYFEEVFFVLKDGVREGEMGGDIVREATRLLSECCGARPPRRRPREGTCFLLGAGVAALLLLPLLFFL